MFIPFLWFYTMMIANVIWIDDLIFDSQIKTSLYYVDVYFLGGKKNIFAVCCLKVLASLYDFNLILLHFQKSQTDNNNRTTLTTTTQQQQQQQQQQLNNSNNNSNTNKTTTCLSDVRLNPLQLYNNETENKLKKTKRKSERVRERERIETKKTHPIKSKRLFLIHMYSH